MISIAAPPPQASNVHPPARDSAHDRLGSFDSVAPDSTHPADLISAVAGLLFAPRRRGGRQEALGADNHRHHFMLPPIATVRAAPPVLF